ncbi:hypothetical protein AAFC00_006301 [Neodothiora populina]|uniref:Uncharacterized protein n=1 Tax=Neodothiora populina TaxID=2781224 RepID=A0ABR3P4Q4_9PEZI
MQTENTNPILAQVPLSVSPFITLPKAPTLPHNYATLPSTLPPSILSSAPSASSKPTTDANSSASEDPRDALPAYVTSASGFRAHPRAILAQNRALAEQLRLAEQRAREEIEGWLAGIRERELMEKRRKAPGWLDSEEKMLRPARKGEEKGAVEVGDAGGVSGGGEKDVVQGGGMVVNEDAEVNDLGLQMDRAFG